MYKGIWGFSVKLLRMLITFIISGMTTAHVKGPEALQVQSSVCVSAFFKIWLCNTYTLTL